MSGSVRIGPRQYWHSIAAVLSSESTDKRCLNTAQLCSGHWQRAQAKLSVSLLPLAGVVSTEHNSMTKAKLQSKTLYRSGKFLSRDLGTA